MKVLPTSTSTASHSTLLVPCTAIVGSQVLQENPQVTSYCPHAPSEIVMGRSTRAGGFCSSRIPALKARSHEVTFAPPAGTRLAQVTVLGSVLGAADVA